jgi:ElaA protein
VRHAVTAVRPSVASPIHWEWRAFDELPAADLYALLQLRQAVFVVEQHCPYLDTDGYDARAWHLLGWAGPPSPDAPAARGAPAALATRGDGTVLAAYARLFAPGSKYADASIGRVVSNPVVRRSGLGKALMAEAVRRCAIMAPGADVRIEAQMYLQRFYEGFGFRRVSEPYEEDGIMHVTMVRSAEA